MNQIWFQRAMVIIFTALTGLLLGVIAFLARESLLVLTILLSSNAYLPRALDKVYLIVLGLVWLVGWLGFEGYLSSGVAKKTVFARFLRLLGWEMVALFACSILSYLVTETGVNWMAVGLLLLALAAGVGLLLLARRGLAAPRKI